MKTARTPKYRNVKCEWRGERFDSKAELARYLELRALMRVGEVNELRRQPVFVLIPAVVIDGRKKPAIRYKADFEYFDKAGAHVIEDVKGMATPMYRAKRHMMKALLGLDIREIKK